MFLAKVLRRGPGAISPLERVEQERLETIYQTPSLGG